MSNRSVFYEDWRDCLRAHYIQVIATNDTANALSLRTVLSDTGFSDGEIAQMHAVYDKSADAEPLPTEPILEGIPEPLEPPPDIIAVSAEAAPTETERSSDTPATASSMGTYQPSLF